MSMFGQFSTYSASNEWKLIDLLESSNVTVEQLLDDESIVSIARTNNTKLMDFILSSKNFNELISYLITEPQEIIRPIGRNNYSTQQTKLPFISCELLSNDVESIMNKLLENPVLMQTDTDTVPDDSPLNADSEHKSGSFSNMLNRSNVAECNGVESFKVPDENIKTNGKHDKEIENSTRENHIMSSKPILQPMMSELTENSGEKNHLFATFNSQDDDDDLEEEIFPCAMEYMLNFFNNKPPLNPTMCGYVSKVLKNLYTNRPVQLANLLFETLYSQFKKILNHLYSDSLCDLLQLLIKMETLISNDTVQGERRSEMVLILANSFSTPIYKVPLDEDLAQDYIENISTIFASWFGSFKQINGGSRILKPLVKNIYFTPLAFIIENATNSQLKAISKYISAFCMFLKELIAAEETDTLQDSPLSVSYQNDSNNAVFGSHVYKSNSNNIESAANYELIFTEMAKIAECALRILQEHRQQEYTVTFPAGYSSNLIGHRRYYLYEMITAILKLDTEIFEKRIIDGHFFETSLEIMEQNCWSNILHSMIYKMLEFIIESRWYEASKVVLLNQADLIGFIIKETKNPYYTHQSKTAATTVKGHIAYLMKLANLLHKSEDERVRKLIRESSSYAKWEEFIDTELKAYNKKNNGKLGDTDPKAGMSQEKARSLKDSEAAMLNEIENVKEDEPTETKAVGNFYPDEMMLIEKEASMDSADHMVPERSRLKELVNSQMSEEGPCDSHMETKFLSPDLWHDGGTEKVVTENVNNVSEPAKEKNTIGNSLFRMNTPFKGFQNSQEYNP